MTNETTTPAANTTTVDETKRAAAIQKRKELARVYINEEFLPEHDIAWVVDECRLVEYLGGAYSWINISRDSLKASYPKLRGDVEWDTLLEVLKEADRFKKTSDTSFRKLPPDVLNKMRIDHWLQPSFEVVPETDIWFDLLLKSVCGEKQENIDHVLQVFGWKYLHPETFTLPAMCFYGEGGSGKNMLAEILPGIIFGHQATKVSLRQIERFNSSLIGKVVVFFDEKLQREDEEDLKALVMNARISTEQKRQDQKDVDNTALYIIASQKHPIKIQHDGSERRWSLINCKRSLVSIVSEHFAISSTDAAAAIFEASKSIFRNPEVVARYVGRFVKAAQALDSQPTALHGEDYKTMVIDQIDTTEELLEEVFVVDKKFDYITAKMLYSMYVGRTKAANPSAAPMSMLNFGLKAKGFLDKHGLSESIEKTPNDKRVYIKTGPKQQELQSIFYKRSSFSDMKPTSVNDNSAKYLTGTYQHNEQIKQSAKMNDLTRSVLRLVD
jgi:hypothetical protein